MRVFIIALLAAISYAQTGRAQGNIISILLSPAGNIDNFENLKPADSKVVTNKEGILKSTGNPEVVVTSQEAILKITCSKEEVRSGHQKQVRAARLVALHKIKQAPAECRGAWCPRKPWRTVRQETRNCVRESDCKPCVKQMSVACLNGKIEFQIATVTKMHRSTMWNAKIIRSKRATKARVAHGPRLNMNVIPNSTP